MCRTEPSISRPARIAPYVSNYSSGSDASPIRSRYEEGVSILVYSKREFPVLSGRGLQLHMCQFVFLTHMLLFFLTHMRPIFLKYFYRLDVISVRL
jgi:hypothetical protein